MKIRLSQLRRIIRETIEEQGWVPGRWNPTQGEPVDREELDLLGTLGLEDEDSEINEEASLTTKGLVGVDWETIAKRFPEFARQVKNAYKGDLKRASFAVSKQGFLGMGKSVPLVAFDSPSMPVVYWDDDVLKTNSSVSLGDAVRKSKS